MPARSTGSAATPGGRRRRASRRSGSRRSPTSSTRSTAATLAGAETERIEIGTAVVPVQPRHPIALAQQALSTQAVCGGRLTLGLGVSHHWVIDEMLGLPYERPVPTMRSHLDVLDVAFRARAWSTSRTTCSGCTTRSTSPT